MKTYLVTLTLQNKPLVSKEIESDSHVLAFMQAKKEFDKLDTVKALTKNDYDNLHIDIMPIQTDPKVLIYK